MGFLNSTSLYRFRVPVASGYFSVFRGLPQRKMLPASRPRTTPKPAANAEFSAAADEVLAQMSEITGLKLRTPLKKTLRSREEIRAYVIREMNEDKEPAERYASSRSAEAFGLLPKGFDFDTFMVDLLTEQIAGLYDPKAHEFYIADWIPLSDQRMVMAHELTHALEDQHFQIEAWMKAARPNDDAELAREAVLEGSAMAAMIDYLLGDTGRSLKDLPDIDPSMLVGDMGSTPGLKKAPPFLKDALVFPYFAGLTFSADLVEIRRMEQPPAVFSKPPVSTQQIMHPALYRASKAPAVVNLPDVRQTLGAGMDQARRKRDGGIWLEGSVETISRRRSRQTACGVPGMATAMRCMNKNAPSGWCWSVAVRFRNEAQAARYFGQYSEALEKKYQQRTNLFRRPNFFSFDSAGRRSVSLRCVNTECITVEGTTRGIFDSINKAIGWTGAPVAPIDRDKPAVNATTTRNLTTGDLVVAASRGGRQFKQTTCALLQTLLQSADPFYGRKFSAFPRPREYRLRCAACKRHNF